MMMTISEQRSAVVAEALTWLRTPFAHQQRLKGVAVDCGYFLSKTYEVSLGWPEMDFGNYSPQWALHNDEHINFYVSIVKQHCIEIPEPPSPGDIILMHFGRGYSHGGIVIDWPDIIHADSFTGKRVMCENLKYSPLRLRKRLFFSPKQWHLDETVSA